MPSFGQASQERLATCSATVQQVINAAIEITDFTVVCGYRNALEQEKAYKSGKSTKPYPDSVHNTFPSNAIDVAPYDPTFGILWASPQQATEIADARGCTTQQAFRWMVQRYAYLFGVIKGLAAVMCPEVKVRWGNDWDSDDDYLDQNFIDMPHVEFLLPDTDGDS